uniref:DM5 domain-containing protein n=1 Tax=Steinernema glaseri TaxID=37863 RepID=A0A1I7Z9H8_9BILA
MHLRIMKTLVFLGLLVVGLVSCHPVEPEPRPETEYIVVEPERAPVPYGHQNPIQKREATLDAKLTEKATVEQAKKEKAKKNPQEKPIVIGAPVAVPFQKKLTDEEVEALKEKIIKAVTDKKGQNREENKVSRKMFSAYSTPKDHVSPAKTKTVFLQVPAGYYPGATNGQQAYPCPFLSQLNNFQHFQVPFGQILPRSHERTPGLSMSLPLAAEQLPASPSPLRPVLPAAPVRAPLPAAPLWTTVPAAPLRPALPVPSLLEPAAHRRSRAPGISPVRQPQRLRIGDCLPEFRCLPASFKHPLLLNFIL